MSPLISLPKLGTKFLEERPGVLSMARLAAFLQTVGGFVVLMAVVAVSIRDGEHAAGIIAAMAAASATAFAGAWAALKERHKPADDETSSGKQMPGLSTVSIESQGGVQKTTVTAQPVEGQ